ncbi:MAG: Xaa-Pro peptidase family protein [Solirubrobacterales bacterium]
MRERDDLPFAMVEYKDRIGRVRAKMAEKGLDAMVVTTPANLHWLTGYETQGLWYLNALVLPVDGQPAMVTRAAEQTVVEAYTWVEQRRGFADHEPAVDILAEVIGEMGLDHARLGYESDSYYLRTMELDELRAALPTADFDPCVQLIEWERIVKSPAELEYVRAAAAAADAGVAAGIAAVAEGVAENEIAGDVYRAMLRAGGQWGPMAPFVVSGPRSFVSHATWRERVLTNGDCVFFEVGGCVHRYNAPIMRTASVGPKSAKLREAEGLVLEAVDAAMEEIRPGASTSTPDRVAREIIARNSFGAQQYTRVGYSVGVAFPPGWGEGHVIDIKSENDSEFRAGMTFHLIPFLQIPDEAAVGISETILVTEDGCERLTATDRRVFEC